MFVELPKLFKILIKKYKKYKRCDNKSYTYKVVLWCFAVRCHLQVNNITCKQSKPISLLSIFIYNK